MSVHPDTLAIDKIACLLGTLREWDSETIEYVAEIVEDARKGCRIDDGPAKFAAAFVATTGREIPDGYDHRDEYDEDEDEDA